eukprot:2053896-Pleurochrysis_carterae.AAC.1
MGHGSSEAEEQYEAQYSVAAPLFQTPPPPITGATAPARTRSRDEIAPMANLDSAVPNSDATNVPLPESWYAIVGGPFEGVRLGNYDNEIRREVEGYPNCRAYSFNAGVTDEATATRLLRQVREQRLRD